MEWLLDNIEDARAFLIRCKDDEDGRFVLFFGALTGIALLCAPIALPGSHLSVFAMFIILAVLFLTNARISFWRMDAPRTAVRMTALAELKEEQHGTEGGVGAGPVGDGTPEEDHTYSV